MAILAFPAGLLWVWIAPNLEPVAQAVTSLAGLPPASWRAYGPELLTWLGATLLGYVQWFWLVPHVFALRASD